MVDVDNACNDFGQEDANNIVNYSKKTTWQDLRVTTLKKKKKEVNLKGYSTATAAKRSNIRNIVTWIYGITVRFPDRTLHLLAVHCLTCI